MFKNLYVKKNFIIAQIDFETKKWFTYSEIISTTKALAAGLHFRLGLKHGDNVAIAMPASCMEYPIAILAINLCGASATLINPSLTQSSGQLHIIFNKIVFNFFF